MLTVESIISSKAGREIRRSLAVKMSLKGFETKDICELLNVSDSFVSKWNIIYENRGADALLLGYRGSESFLTDIEREEIISYLQSKTDFSIEELRDYIEKKYGVIYKSKQSYYELFDSAKLSWHKSQKTNPKKNCGKVLLKREEIKKNLMNVNLK
ncbi:MAG: transposase [Desulfococcaceae bacterium]